MLPAAKSHGRSARFGSFIFMKTTTITSVQEATKYLRNPNENAEKYCSASRVKT
jgi:hypothetical protein